MSTDVFQKFFMPGCTLAMIGILFFGCSVPKQAYYFSRYTVNKADDSVTTSNNFDSSVVEIPINVLASTSKGPVLLSELEISPSSTTFHDKRPISIQHKKPTILKSLRDLKKENSSQSDDPKKEKKKNIITVALLLIPLLFALITDPDGLFIPLLILEFFILAIILGIKAKKKRRAVAEAKKDYKETEKIAKDANNLKNASRLLLLLGILSASIIVFFIIMMSNADL